MNQKTISLNSAYVQFHHISLGCIFPYRKCPWNNLHCIPTVYISDSVLSFLSNYSLFFWCKWDMRSLDPGPQMVRTLNPVRLLSQDGVAQDSDARLCFLPPRLWASLSFLLLMVFKFVHKSYWLFQNSSGEWGDMNSGFASWTSQLCSIKQMTSLLLLLFSWVVVEASIGIITSYCLHNLGEIINI
jgi:hypothetical protein